MFTTNTNGYTNTRVYSTHSSWKVVGKERRPQICAVNESMPAAYVGTSPTKWRTQATTTDWSIDWL